MGVLISAGTYIALTLWCGFSWLPASDPFCSPFLLTTPELGFFTTPRGFLKIVFMLTWAIQEWRFLVPVSGVLLGDFLAAWYVFIKQDKAKTEWEQWLRDITETRLASHQRLGERHLGRQLNGHIVYINWIDVLSSRPTLRESSGWGLLSSCRSNGDQGEWRERPVVMEQSVVSTERVRSGWGHWLPAVTYVYMHICE